MNKSDFIAALQAFGNSCNTEIIPAGNDSFELKFREDPSRRRVFIQLGMEPNGEAVSEILYRCLCGVITNPRALSNILIKNFGGVMDTEFFFFRESNG